MVCTGFKRNIQNRPGYQFFIPGFYAVYTIYFGMGPAILKMCPFTNDPSFMYQNSTYQRVRGHIAAPFFCQFKATVHVLIMKSQQG
jgi:hypothetical protein